ncbi:MAG: response regulator [Candidatus Mariimomonas ferrooxydans]
MNEDKGRILVIDDEFSPREALRFVLKDIYDVTVVSGGVEGLDFISQNPVDLVIVDIMMPEMDGITTLKKIKNNKPDIEVVILTAYASVETAKSAIRFAAFDYLTKPFDKDDVLKVVERGLEKKRAEEKLKLEQSKLRYRTKFLEEQVNIAKRDILLSYEGTIKALILTIDAKDHYTFDHSEHVARLSTEIGNALNMSGDEVERLGRAANIHDIGKIGIDEMILRKNGELTPEEFLEVKKHPRIGATIVEQVPFLQDAIPVILHHHERYDGRGYPMGLKSEKIPLNSRIIVVADAIDAMMHSRPYRHSFPMQRVFFELEHNAGTQFDPMIIDLILKNKISFT